MFCSNCGNEIKDGQKFCTACGTPVPEQTLSSAPDQADINTPQQSAEYSNPETVQSPEQSPVAPESDVIYNTSVQNTPIYNTDNQNTSSGTASGATPSTGYSVTGSGTPSAPVGRSGNKSGLVMMISLIAGSVVLLFIGSLITTNMIEKTKEDFAQLNSYDDIDFDPDDYWDDDDLNIDWDSLNMDDYDFDYDFDSENDYFDDYDPDDYDFDEYADDYEDTLEDYKDSDDSSSFSSTADPYKYATVEYKEDGIILTPKKGTVNDSTIVYDGKDIGGFLDYVDDKVLEKGRSINREFFYDLYAVNIVDPDVYQANPSQMIFGLVSSLSFANEFHTMNVSVDSLSVSNDSPDVYNYNVTAIGKKDLWSLDFAAKTMYMNDGKTEYVSSMLKDETLAVWATAVEEYFGLSL